MTAVSPEAGPHPDRATEQRHLAEELAAEQRYLAQARAVLAGMRQTARYRVETGANVAGDGYTAETLGRRLRAEAKALAEEPESPLYFGRLGFTDGPDAGEHRGQRYYIGRRHVGEAAGEPVVIDWRAPVARAFYQASRDHPQGVRVRRRYGWATRTDRPAELTGFEDEPLVGPGSGTGTGAGAGAGDGPVPSRLVAAEIGRPRIGPMRDIVATIQPEQDRLVRADLDESICVQGAPGTGKTAVGLHRAAYLLYTHRQRLRRAGVLVVGPNPAFLRYISAVLPALGEVDVRQSTLEGLIGGYPVRAVESPAAAAVKHDARMATVLYRALYARVGEPDEPLVVPDGSARWQVSAAALRRLVEEVLGAGLPYLLGRERLRARVTALLQRQAETRESPGAAWVRRMSHSRPVRDLLDRVWPAVRPAELVASLLGDPRVRADAADGLLTDAEQAAIAWPRPRTPKSAAWTTADLVLLDEAAGLLDRPEGFGHIVLDEAQDLSPMECRVIARRAAHGSLTVLGDLAQATTVWAARNWSEQLVRLGKPDATITALTTGFRLPAPVVEVANRLLPLLAVDVPAARSLRTDGRLRVSRTPDPVAHAVAAARAALDQPGSIAVICADAALPGLTAALLATGVPVATPDRPDGAARVTALPATLAKGLEYDHVVVVEPAEIVAAEPRGLHRLYVVLTRAVTRLEIVHARPLPAGLDRPDGA
ncbi:AAA family ATPase [Micromonospora sp. NPDC049559]|uniref:HelD family protein n=1 Tax=Micromonospora sp. NPDC049559 TaxID=3155923 RepID=UPI0034388E33